MKKEDKYNFLLLVLALLVILSVFLFKNIYLFYIFFIISIATILFKRWVMGTLFKYV